MILTGIIGVFAFGFAMSAIGSATNPNPSSGNVVNGQQGYLRTSKGTNLPVFVSEDALNEFIQDNINHDTYGQEQMLTAGRIFFVPNGTQILVIGGDLTTREVRILSGVDTGQGGYVVAEEVSAN